LRLRVRLYSSLINLRCPLAEDLVFVIIHSSPVEPQSRKLNLIISFRRRTLKRPRRSRRLMNRRPVSGGPMSRRRVIRESVILGAPVDRRPLNRRRVRRPGSVDR
jgi:hypothetical protein